MILPGSPPNAGAALATHFNAANWSINPKFDSTPPDRKNPNAPRRYCGANLAAGGSDRVPPQSGRSSLFEVKNDAWASLGIRRYRSKSHSDVKKLQRSTLACATPGAHTT